MSIPCLEQRMGVHSGVNIVSSTFAKGLFDFFPTIFGWIGGFCLPESCVVKGGVCESNAKEMALFGMPFRNYFFEASLMEPLKSR